MPFTSTLRSAVRCSRGPIALASAPRAGGADAHSPGPGALYMYTFVFNTVLRAGLSECTMCDRRMVEVSGSRDVLGLRTAGPAPADALRLKGGAPQVRAEEDLCFTPPRPARMREV